MRLMTMVILSGSIITTTLNARQVADTPALALDELLDAEGQVWAVDAKEFIRMYGSHGFRWISQDDRSAVHATGIPMTFLGIKVIEAIARFDSESKLSELEFLVYSRGDLGDMDRPRFVAMVQHTENTVNTYAKVRPRKMPAESNKQGIERRALVWTKAPHRMKSESSYTRGSYSSDGFKFRAEFLRVFCQSVKATRRYDSTIHQRATPGVIGMGRLRDRVKKGLNGDVFIEGVPMVDQGQKGYCAVATAERTLRYFGRELDQHELAQLANTSAKMGTNPEVMVDVLKRLGKKYDCVTKVYEKIETRSFVRMIKKYNRLAKRQKKPEIDLEGKRTIYISDIYKAADITILWSVRLNPRTAYNNFMKDIKKNIDQGYPMQWSTIIGLVAETPPIDGFGGHMRLIIGYNSKNGELLYSDTWGQGHESKRMKGEDAWGITTGLYMIRPRSSMM